MAQGRGSASGVMAMAGLLMFLVVAHLITVDAAVYTVGDSGGWTFNVVNWPRGKAFKAGDVLLFKYSPTSHNVVFVNGNGYSACSTPSGARILQSGNDRVTLKRGQNFFICNFPGHCQGGMKIAVSAA